MIFVLGLGHRMREPKLKKAPSWFEKMKSVLSKQKGKQIKRHQFIRRRTSSISCSISSTDSQQSSQKPSPVAQTRKKYNLKDIPYGEPKVQNNA